MDAPKRDTIIASSTASSTTRVLPFFQTGDWSRHCNSAENCGENYCEMHAEFGLSICEKSFDVYLEALHISSAVIT